MNFSVIIPAYNCIDTLEATVKSIQKSGLKDYEIILIDDGSTDGTAELCDELCEKNAEFRCIHQTNAGVSAARNLGIEEARGEYIWFVDSDDTVDAGSLLHAAEIVFEQRPDMLIFGMQFDYYNRDILYHKEELVYPKECLYGFDDIKFVFKDLYKKNALSSSCNKFIRKDVVIKDHIHYCEGMILMEDFLFVLDLLPHCRSVYCLPEVIYRYKQAEDEKGAYRRLQKISDLAEYMEPFERSVEKSGIPSEVVAELYKMLLHQKMYYMSLGDIKKTLQKHLNSRYSELDVERSPVKIFINNKKTQVRHKIAVVVKTILARQKQRKNL